MSVSYEEFKQASEAELKPMRVHDGTIAFMFESSLMLPLTDYAIKRSGVLHEHDPQMWDGLGAQFMDHLGEVNAELRKAGRQEIQTKKT
jgi:homogentisate 1,2-dioxygenase